MVSHFLCHLDLVYICKEAHCHDYTLVSLRRESLKGDTFAPNAAAHQGVYKCSSRQFLLIVNHYVLTLKVLFLLNSFLSNGCSVTTTFFKCQSRILVRIRNGILFTLMAAVIMRRTTSLFDPILAIDDEFEDFHSKIWEPSQSCFPSIYFHDSDCVAHDDFL